MVMTQVTWVHPRALDYNMGRRLAVCCGLERRAAMKPVLMEAKGLRGSRDTAMPRRHQHLRQRQPLMPTNTSIITATTLTTAITTITTTTAATTTITTVRHHRADMRTRVHSWHRHDQSTIITSMHSLTDTMSTIATTMPITNANINANINAAAITSTTARPSNNIRRGKAALTRLRCAVKQPTTWLRVDLELQLVEMEMVMVTVVVTRWLML